MAVSPVTRTTFPSYDRTAGQGAILAPTTTVGRTPIAVVASRAYFARFVPSRNMTIRSIAFVVTTVAGSDDAVDVGIYDSTLTKIVSAGATTGKQTAQGRNSVAVTATNLTAGTVYYAGISFGTIGTTAAQVDMTSFPTFGSTIHGTATGTVEACLLTSGHPLGAGPITPTSAGNNVPFLSLSES